MQLFFTPDFCKGGKRNVSFVSFVSYSENTAEVRDLTLEKQCQTMALYREKKGKMAHFPSKIPGSAHFCSTPTLKQSCSFTRMYTKKVAIFFIDSFAV